MLRNVRTISALSFIGGVGILALACVSPLASGELSNTPNPPTAIPSPDGIALYSENDCKNNNVGLTDGTAGQLIQFITDDRFQNDEARSLLFTKLSPGTIIRLFDHPAGDASDDWVEILVMQEVENYCVNSFENSFQDTVISVTFSEVDGLDSKVSFMTVDRVLIEHESAIEDLTPTAEPATTNTPTLTPTYTPLPANPAIPEADCIPTVIKGEFATVSNVVGGHTIDVLIDGVNFQVRYIGVDTPEVGEPYFNQVASQNAGLVAGNTVTLLRDVSHTDADGRLLRYVLSGNQFVNYELVRQGFAMASTNSPDVACSTTFVEAQNQAVSEGAGLWTLIPTPLPPTDTPASVPNIQIIFIFFEGDVPGMESDEFAQITNQGLSAVNLQGWRLNAGDPEQDFYFPNFLLNPGLSCRIYTDENHPEYCGFSFDIRHEIWDNGEDCGYLYDDKGAQVSKYCY